MHLIRKDTFYGWRVVGATFVLAVFGLGIGFHGPAVYLHAVHERTGWPLALISTAVTVHFLAGAIVVANLPALHRLFGIPATTKAGAILLAVGVFGWATAAAPWQLFGATLLSGAGWVTMGVAAINAIVAPWFDRDRPGALAMAYNGGNIGGVVFSPLWAAAIAAIGFPAAAVAICIAMAVTMWVLAEMVFSKTPQQMRSLPDGDETRTVSITSSAAEGLPGSLLWPDAKFVMLAAGMALGLFAQIGLAVHLFSLLVPALGATQAGLAMGLVTAMAIAGRSLIGWSMPASADRRLVACASYAVQIAGCAAFIAADGASVPLLLLGRRPVRRRIRQRHMAATADRSSRIRRGRCAARGRADCRDLARNLRLRSRRIRHGQGIRFARRRRRFRRRAGVLCRRRNCAGTRDLCVYRGKI